MIEGISRKSLASTFQNRFFPGAWLTALLLSASSMMIETAAFRQWQVFLRMDPLPFVLPMVMAGLAAGAIVFYSRNKKTAAIIGVAERARTDTDFISLPLVAYAVFAPVGFLLLPFSTRTEGLPALLFEASSAFSCFLMFAFWGYINSAIFDRCSNRIFPLYGATLLGTIFGGCAAIVLMNLQGVPFAILCSMALVVVTAWEWAMMTLSLNTRTKYATTLVALAAIVAGFALPAECLTVFHEKRTPEWFDSNSFSQLDIYPVSPSKILRAPGMETLASDPSNIQAWRVYFDGRRSYHTYIVRYGKLDDAKFLNQDLSSLAFRIGNPERALILGAGGGVEVIQGLLAGCREIDAVDINPLLVRAIQWTGASAFLHADGVHYYLADGRKFMLRTARRYDLIFLPNVIRGQGVSGVVNSQYMHTVEQTIRYLDNLNTGGALVIRSFRNDWPYLFGTLKVALNKRPGTEKWSVFLASNENIGKVAGLIIVRRTSLLAAQNRTVSRFIDQGGFSWVPVDLHEIRDGLVLTDDHPYAVSFSQLFGAHAQQENLAVNNSLLTRPVFIRYAVFLGVALLIIVSLVSAQIGLSRMRDRRNLFMSSLYLAALGSGFIAAEMVLVEKTFIVNGNPTVAFGITVCALMGGALLAIWSLRNFDSGKIANLLPKTALAAAVALSLAFFALGKLAGLAILPDWLMTVLAVLGILPAGTLMGVLFPAGLRLLAEAEQESIPWSWAINGAAAMLGGVASKLLAVIFGYHALLAFAVASYIAAAIASPGLDGMNKTLTVSSVRE